MRLFFLLTPVKALPVCGLDSGWEGVCTRVEGSSLNMEYGSATRGVFIYAIYIQIKNTNIVNTAEGHLGPRAVSSIGTVPLLRTALRVITHNVGTSNLLRIGIFEMFTFRLSICCNKPVPVI